MPAKKVPFHGSCEDLNRRVKDGGLVIPGTKPTKRFEKGHPGFTSAEVDFVLHYAVSYEPVKREGFVCPDGQFFTDIKECQRKCRTKIGTIPCAPGTITTYQATLEPELSFSTTTWRIDYQLPPDASEAAREDVNRWHSEIERHEAGHSSDIERRQQEFHSEHGRKLSKYFTGTDGEGAEKKCQAWVDKEIKRILQKWADVLKNDERVFHGTPAGKIPIEGFHCDRW